MSDDGRLDRQIRFVEVLDGLKSVFRRNRLMTGERLENSAEHSWHIGVMAGVLAEHAPAPINVERVTIMLLIHDVVEIDAGDTFCYDAAANVGKEERERAAADRLFGLLPADQAQTLRALWDEFEAAETVDARYANALDRFQVLLQNFHDDGGTWVEYGVKRSQVEARMRPIQSGAPGLWGKVQSLIEEASAKGWIQQD